MSKIKIMVADDQPAFREGICRYLDDEKDFEVIAKPTDGEEAVNLAKNLKPDVVLIAIAMPKLNGIEAAKQIKAACPSTAILTISAYNYESYVIGSLRAGAEGFILRTVPISEIVSAIRLVLAGEAVFDLKAISTILERLVNMAADESSSHLHRREVQILRLAAKGMTNRQISDKLGISSRTVQTHMVHIFRKLQVTSRTEAVLHALRKGWLMLDEFC
jgi:NarL family two-component system response regulator LiaR